MAVHSASLPSASIRSAYGAKHDAYDDRDHKVNYQLPVMFEKIDLSQESPHFSTTVSMVPRIYDQGNLSSCTANAVCAAYGMDLVKQTPMLAFKRQSYDFYSPSRLFVYYNAREKNGESDTDAGTSVRDAIKAFNKYGACPENENVERGGWPYDVLKFAERPPVECYQQARGNKICAYKRLSQEINQFRICLAIKRFPFVFGFRVFESFHQIQSAGKSYKPVTVDVNATIAQRATETISPAYVMPMPSEGEGELGLHAVVAVGYNNKTNTIKALNSWGSAWGDGGFFYMPYAFILDNTMCFDFWQVTFACTA